MKYEIFIWLGIHCSLCMWALSSRDWSRRGSVTTKEAVFLFLCLGCIDFMRKWEKWEKFFWHLKYFLSRIGTQTLSLIEAITTFSSQASPTWSLGRGVGRAKDATIYLWNLDRTGSLVQKLLYMNRHRHRHSHFDCSMFVLFRYLDWKCEGREREQVNNLLSM